jgi:hypothetical protein
LAPAHSSCELASTPFERADDAWQFEGPLVPCRTECPHPEGRYSSQLSALVVPRFDPPRELPTGSTVDASFEATGDLSAWPLSLRGISLCELAITLTRFRSELRRR